jgi:hypothetical protein
MLGNRQRFGFVKRGSGVVVLLAAVLLAMGDRPSPASAQTAPFAWGQVKVCTDRNFFGTCATFSFDVPEFGATAIGNDRATSLELWGPNVVALYEDKNYQGRCMTVMNRDPMLSHQINDLGWTVFGNDRLSSMRVGVECVPGTELVALCWDAFYGGRCASFPSWDFSNYGGPRQPLSYEVDAQWPNPMNRLGDNAASSVLVPAGMRVQLEQGGGSSVRQTFCANAPWLGVQPIGNDTVSIVTPLTGSC